MLLLLSLACYSEMLPSNLLDCNLLSVVSSTCYGLWKSDFEVYGYFSLAPPSQSDYIVSSSVLQRVTWSSKRQAILDITATVLT